MTATPARDALIDLLALKSANAGRDLLAEEAVDWCIAFPHLVVAALVESGWRPTVDQLRAMGGEESAFDPYGRGRRLWRFPEGVDGD